MVNLFFGSGESGGFGSIITVFRAFRITRVFRLIKSSKNIRILLDTLIFILPSIANVSSLVCLLFFIYACLGMNLFGTVMRRDNINSHANFENFFSALLLLLRSSTGESWNLLMEDCLATSEYNGKKCIDD